MRVEHRIATRLQLLADATLAPTVVELIHRKRLMIIDGRYRFFAGDLPSLKLRRGGHACLYPPSSRTRGTMAWQAGARSCIVSRLRCRLELRNVETFAPARPKSWLSAAICEGIVLMCKANVFIRSVAVPVCSLRNLVCFFAVLVRPVTGFIRRGFISRISTLSHRRFTLVVWISPNRQFATSRIRRAG